MTFSSSLNDNYDPLILDTSVVINLHASTWGAQILRALPNVMVVPELVAAELEHETSKGNGEHQFVQALATGGIVERSELTDREYVLYEEMVTGGNSLGDGEAAAIAMAAERNHIAVIDERRGRKLARQLLPVGRMAWSVDLILHPIVAKGLGRKAQTEAVYLALRDGRMRVHDDHCDQVVGLIGVRRALKCTSLPGFRHRRHSWKQATAGTSNDHSEC